MGIVKKPLPGKLIMSAIYSSIGPLDDAVAELERKLGKIEYETEEIDFLHTTYYREEMGDNLRRKFFSFENMVERDRLPEIKLLTNKIEAKFGETVNDFVFRKVNLDPGILTLANLTLASTKDYSHRIYLGNGIFGEITLVYKKKNYIALPWTYPDYFDKTALEFFSKVRLTMKGMIFDE